MKFHFEQRAGAPRDLSIDIAPNGVSISAAYPMSGIVCPLVADAMLKTPWVVDHMRQQ